MFVVVLVVLRRTICHDTCLSRHFKICYIKMLFVCYRLDFKYQTTCLITSSKPIVTN